jgi:glycosyltransferase involved in cell wall biosynthesis
MSRRLLLVGLDYAPWRGTGDKNFWVSLVPALARDLDRITIVSVRAETTRRENVRIAGCEVETRYVDPILLRPAVMRGRGGPFSRTAGGSHRRILGQIRRQLVVKSIVAEVRDVLRDGSVWQLHLMDNFGPGSRVIARAAQQLGAGASVTALAYERRGRIFYDRFLRASYAIPEARVVALSRQLERRLLELGVRPDRLQRIPWGVTVADPAEDGDPRSVRAALGMPPGRPLILWAGFIQQVREPDFHRAFRLATAAREQGLDAAVVFAFKPDTIRSEYASLSRPDLGIHVRATQVDEFREILSAADVLFSPVVNRDCIVAPPLTWIEAMASGSPVLTTSVPGADELIENGRTGFLAARDDELVSRLFELSRNHASMADACRQKVADDYNLDDIRRTYLAFWFGSS